MTLSLMAYGLVMASLLAGAAHFLDGALRRLGKPTRWIWMGALAGGALAPFVSGLRPPPPPDLPAPGPALPLELLYQMGLSHGSNGGGGGIPFPPDLPLALVWVAGSSVLLLVFLRAAWILERKSRSWEARRVGTEDVLVSRGLGPAVLGLFKPRIVLPPWALSLAAEEREMVLLHEREHRKARDPLAVAGGMFFLVLAPWNPSLWWALSRLRLAVEGDCDGRVLARGIHAKAYGALLLEMARRTRKPPGLALALSEGGKTSLERRLLMIPQPSGKSRRKAATAAALAGFFLLALACETPLPPVESPAAPPAIYLTNPSEDTPSPMVFVDGVLWSDPEGLESLDRNLIESVNILRGEAAVTLYGEEASNGVIQIRLKDGGGSTSGASDERTSVQLRGGKESEPVSLRVTKTPAEAGADGRPPVIRIRGVSRAEGDPLILVDGVVVSDPDFLGTVDPARIDRVEVIKGEAAEALFGPRGANGVIKIFMKKKGTDPGP